MFTRRKLIVKDLGIDVTAAEIEQGARYLKSARLQQDLRIAQIIPLLGGADAVDIRHAATHPLPLPRGECAVDLSNRHPACEFFCAGLFD